MMRHWGGGGEGPNLRARPGSGPATFRRIVGFFRPYRRRLAWIAALIVVTVGHDTSPRRSGRPC